MSKTKSRVAERELSQARRKRHHAEVIRNRIVFGVCCVAVLAFVIFLIVKLVSGISNSYQEAETSTLTFNADGTITYEEITDFDETEYSVKDFKNSTNDLIESYNEASGEDSIVLDKLTVKDDEAYVRATYCDADTYTSFTSYEVFMDSVEQAVEGGFDFQSVISQVSDGVKGESVEFEDAAEEFAGLQVAIVKENTTVKVPGNILYVSEHSTTMVDNNTVLISQADGNQDTTEYVYIIFEKDE